MSTNARKQLSVEFYDIAPLSTPVMNGLAIEYGVTNAGTLGFQTTTLDHIGFTVADQVAKKWWPLASITNIRVVGSADDNATRHVKVWIRYVEDPNLYVMPSDSFEKLMREWSAYCYSA